MTESSAVNQRGWDNTPSRNLLLSENLELVRQELLNDGVVFGWHHYCGGGGSGDIFCFCNYESYYQAVRDSRPGDHFTVYSRNKLLAKAIVRLGDSRSDRPILNTLDLTEVKKALAAGKEIAFIWHSVEPETQRIACDAGVLWASTDEELEESLGLTTRCGEFLFFLVDLLDEDASGNLISSGKYPPAEPEAL